MWSRELQTDGAEQSRAELNETMHAHTQSNEEQEDHNISEQHSFQCFTVLSAVWEKACVPD